VLGERIEFFDRHRLLKDQAGSLHHLAERSGREHDDLMTTRLEGAADANERVDISSRSDRGQDEAHQCKVNYMTQLKTIGQIGTAVKDLERAVSFYRDKLGMRFLFQVPPGLAFFDCAGVRLMIEVPPDKEFDHPGSILYFKVDDIQAAYSDLKSRGVDFRDEPHLIAKMPDHELWMAFFRDGEGNTLALMHEKRG
jgi:catechol 2,3-dioxygenase-like lactoylglutathione lyase family enzyme